MSQTTNPVFAEQAEETIMSRAIPIDMATRRRGGWQVALAIMVMALVSIIGVASADAAPAPQLVVDQEAYPTHFTPGGANRVTLFIDNQGDAATGTGVTVVDTLPAGVTANGSGFSYGWICSGTTTVTCTLDPSMFESLIVGPAGNGTNPGAITIGVDVDPGVSGVFNNHVEVSDVTGPLATSDNPIDLDVNPAPFGVVPGSFTADALDAQGKIFTQAGGHPFIATTKFAMGTRLNHNGELIASNDVKDIKVDLPAGFLGDPTAAPQCPASGIGNLPAVPCPGDSQVGVVRLAVAGHGFLISNTVPVYNLKPSEGETAALGFNYTAPVYIALRVREESDYGVTATISGVSSAYGLLGSRLTLWGNPADPRHDPFRLGRLTSGAETRPFLTNPSDCTAGPQTTVMRATSYVQPEVEQRVTSTTPVGVDHCDKLDFAPSIRVTPTSTKADGPSGLAVDITSRVSKNSDGIAVPPVKRVSVALPDGVSISPAAADGLQACSDAQLGIGTVARPACPSAAKIGAVSIQSPLLADPLTGAIYVGTQQSDDPDSGQMFRVFLVARGPGVNVKLRGSVRADPQTGRLTATFDNNPQLPFSTLHVEFHGGPRAPLAMPATCGSKTATAQLTSWGGQTVDLASSFDIDCAAGLGAFGPSLSAGVTSPVAGAFSPFALSIVKPDGNAAVAGLSMVLPAGLLAKLNGNLNTQVGTVKAFAGSGANPFMLPGKVYLEGQYGDAPFSLRVVVPAKAGPFDLGEVVVRQKIYVDPIDAHVTVVSDPVPTIVKGVPVRLQRLDVNVDKPGFMVNPTSCAAKAISATLRSVDGQTAPLTNHFQVGNCAELGLKPSLGLTLSGKGQTTDGKHPAISATVAQPAGQANLKKVRVTLPLSLALDVDNANGLCEFADGSKVEPTCPKNSIVGTATAVTPILDEPLSGPVYFVKNERKDPKSGRSIKTTPKLVIPLVGQNGVKLTLTGTSDVQDNRLVTTFDNIPDAPVSSFKLNINGGKGGILAVSGDKADICKSTQIADQQVDGQNNKAADADVYIETPSCPTKILSKTITKTTVKLKIGGLGAGKVTVTGRGIKKTTKTIAKSTVATITARRTGKSKP
ncbi:MAG: hypothetical protein ABW167_17485, partial [Baekduia sp.]